MSETLFMFGPRYKWPRYIGVAIIIIGLVIGGFVYTKRSASNVKDFSYDRDASMIQDFIVKEWFWMVSDETDLTPNDIEQLMRVRRIDKRSWRSDEPANIKVIRDNDKTEAFIVYFHQRAHRGYIQFLGVAPEARGKNYGRKLVKYALEDLFARGCEYVYLDAKLANEHARKLYEGIGFKEHHRDEKYIQYRLFKKDYKG